MGKFRRVFWSGLVSGALSIVLAPRLRGSRREAGEHAHRLVGKRARRAVGDFAGTPCSGQGDSAGCDGPRPC